MGCSISGLVFLPSWQVVQHAFEVGRHWCDELHAATVTWVRERNPRCMEKRPRQPLHRADVSGDTPVNTTVQAVADDRVADRAQVDADLVCSPGVNRHLTERHARHVVRARDSSHGRAGMFCRADIF
jgi:hypothetical protein